MFDVSEHDRISARPAYGTATDRRDRPRFLFITYFDPTGIATIVENIAAWQNLSQFDIQILNLWSSPAIIPGSAKLGRFAGVIVHCTVAYTPEVFANLDSRLDPSFSQYDGVKVLMKQDEHILPHRTAALVGEKKFDLVITCLPPSEVEKVYPRRLTGPCSFLHAYTGYVSGILRKQRATQGDPRPFDVVYRGSCPPIATGRLGFEKHNIGTRMIEVCGRRGLSFDISSNSAQRLDGAAWLSFLSSGKSVLGTESGSNVFDFDGRVQAWEADFLRRHAGEDCCSEKLYATAHKEFLHAIDGNVNYAQLAPRHLEAAATRTLQILYDGHYSGVFVPHRHFVPLKRDISNEDEVVDAIRDDELRMRLTEAAFDEIICNEAYWYETFVRLFDEKVDGLLDRKGRRSSVGRSSGRPRAYVLTSNDPVNDPRIGWVADTLHADFDVVEIGVDAQLKSEPVYEKAGEARALLKVPESHSLAWLLDGRQTNGFVCFRGGAALAGLLSALFINQSEWEDGYGFVPSVDVGTNRTSVIRYFLKRNAALIEGARALGPADLIVACDLETLPAGCVLKRDFGTHLIYDAHEYWPYSFDSFPPSEQKFWGDLERGLLAEVDFACTVSDPLARAMTADYGVEFGSVPNAMPLGAAPKRIRNHEAAQTHPDGKLRFLFIGGFAPGRGIQLLLDRWRAMPENAVLLLQGPESRERRRLMQAASDLVRTGRVVFPEPVRPNELIEPMLQADVGLIPYEPVSVNNRFCCPNKLTQYMAAGLPIMANSTAYVRSVLEENGAGLVVDFRDEPAFLEACRKLQDPNLRAEMGRRGAEAFRTQFNWDVVSRPLADFAKTIAMDKVGRPPLPKKLSLNFEQGPYWDDAFIRHSGATGLRRRIAASDFAPGGSDIRGAGAGLMRNLAMIRSNLRELGDIALDLARCTSVLTRHPRLTIELVREYIHHHFRK